LNLYLAHEISQAVAVFACDLIEFHFAWSQADTVLNRLAREMALASLLVVVLSNDGDLMFTHPAALVRSILFTSLPVPFPLPGNHEGVCFPFRYWSITAHNCVGSNGPNPLVPLPRRKVCFHSSASEWVLYQMPAYWKKIAEHLGVTVEEAFHALLCAYACKKNDYFVGVSSNPSTMPVCNP
jgi:hypothetical protein